MSAWDWVAVACGGSGVGVLLRALAYQMREKGRRQTMTAVLRELPARGGRVEATDRDGVSWVVDVLDDGEDG